MKKRLLKNITVLLLLVSIFTGLLPIGDFATIKANAAVGDYVDAIDGNGNTIEYQVTHISTGGDHTITENNSVYEISGNNGIIIVAPNITTTIILTGVTRESANGTGVNSRSPLQLGSGSTVTLILLDGTTNTFTCNGTSTSSYSVQAGIHVPSNAHLIIRGQSSNSGELIVTGGAFSAGIGGGPNDNSGNITITGGQIFATARSHGGSAGSANAAAIGSGGGNSVATRSNTNIINICGNAVVTATAAGLGAGIGGGGSNEKSGGNSGTINIYGSAVVNATSSAGGAGIGGGGSRDLDAGSGGTINIYGNATVTATSMENGAGIGGGGAGSSGTPGASGIINIYGNPTIKAETNSTEITAVDIGPGVKSGGILGTENTITITGGSVYVDKASPVTNNTAHGSDVLNMIEVTSLDSTNSPLPNDNLSYTIIGSGANYTYTAVTNNLGKAYLWVPLGTQLVICRDENTNAEIDSFVVPLTSGTLTPITPSVIPGYTVTSALVDVTWDGVISLPPIIYLYDYSTATLTLEAYNSMTGLQISTITHTTASHNANANYNYSTDIPALTSAVNTAFPGQYTLVAQNPTIYYISEISANNVVRIYYAPQQANVVFVEARIASTSGTLIQSYVIPASSGETITLSSTQMPNLGTQGFTTLPGLSILSATEGTASNRIILVYADIRFETTIRNNLDSTVISNRIAPGGTDVLLPPYKFGYIATAYSTDNGTTKTSITSGFAGINATSTTNIIFYYEAIPSGGGNSSGGGSSGGGNTGGSGSSNSNSGNTNSGGNSSNLTNATITIACVDDKGNEIYILSLTAITGSQETISAPPLEGYILSEGEATNQSIIVTSGDNIVTFNYVEGENITDPPAPTTPPGESVSQRGFWWWLPLLIAFLCGAGLMYFLYSRKKDDEE